MCNFEVWFVLGNLFKIMFRDLISCLKIVLNSKLRAAVSLSIFNRAIIFVGNVRYNVL